MTCPGFFPPAKTPGNHSRPGGDGRQLADGRGTETSQGFEKLLFLMGVRGEGGPVAGW